MKTTRMREYESPDLFEVTVEPASRLAQDTSPFYIPEPIQEEEQLGDWES